MSETYNIYETKTHLSKVLEQATEQGEVIIAKSGKPMWKITPISQKPERIPGRLKGKIWYSDDFDDPLPDNILKAFYGGEIPHSLIPPKTGKKSRKK